jgi:hypothetical protein
VPPAGTLSATKLRVLEALERGDQSQQIDLLAMRRTHARQAFLSLAQEQLIRFEENHPSIPPLYNESFTVKRIGEINPLILERSLAEIIRRHEIWRTSYETIGGVKMQIVQPETDRFSLPSVDLRNAPASQQGAEILRLGREQAGVPFDLRHGPLLRGTLAVTGDAESCLVMTAHQSIVDGVSVYQIFIHELSTIYDALALGRSSPLPELPFQFCDFASWQRQWLTPEERGRQLSYWKDHLRGGPPRRRWPTRPPGATPKLCRGHIRPFTLRRDLVALLRRLNHREGSTLFCMLLAAFYLLVHCYSGQSDLIVGTFSPAGRKRLEVQHLLGYFLNPVAVRVILSDNPTFIELLHRAGSATSEAISNDDVPFEDVVRELTPTADPDDNPYFSVALSLQPRAPDLGISWTVTSMDAESGGAKLDLYLAFIELADQLHVRVQYNADVFEYAEIEKLVDDFQSILQICVARPNTRVFEMPIIKANR